jgi:hemerythrin
MSHLAWKDSYKINVRELDSQHEDMAALVNRIYESVISQESMETLNRLLLDLIEFTREHFSTEEKMMIEYDYTAYPSHKAEHDDLLKQLEDFREAASSKSRSTFRFELDISEDWFMKHINTSDRALAAFLNEKGVF